MPAVATEVRRARQGMEPRGSANDIKMVNSFIIKANFKNNNQIFFKITLLQ
jgi:hypothetical protein